jgi:uncharacterized membrane protein
MKNPAVSLIALTLIASSASADIIKCVFTEPFANTTYSMAQQSLTLQRPSQRTQVQRNVSFQIRGPARFDIVASDGKVLQQLRLNYTGSDGMSDRVYPYSVTYLPMRNGANGGVGGCYSNYLKPTQ